ncbi:hypothetical protein AB1Y20_012087 [Prymnesium parvum]|uniref:Sulfatase N-terminal domain-containing protein n=1 Tax=Prymnesium parvum TaxID=97485 RepID=A0AB34INR0_PRYPA
MGSTRVLLLLGLGAILGRLLPSLLLIGHAPPTPSRNISPQSEEPTSAANRTLPPHIVVILLDDAGAADAAAFGHPLLLTPHIDRFAAEGTSFSQAYAGAPNCSPSRAALLTGRSPYRTGVFDFLSRQSATMHLRKSERTIAALLKARGYATLHMGKWHLSRALGTRHAVGYSPYHFGFSHSNGSFLLASELLRGFVGWLSSGRQPDQRFFAYLALWEPHEPVRRWAPAEYQELYTSRVGEGGTREELARSVALGGECSWRLPQRDPPRVYYGCMSQVDAAIGDTLAALQRLRLRDDSLIVLTSDNGPEHREVNSWGSSGGLRGAKGYVYEGGIRVPLVMQWRSLSRPPAVLHEPVHLWDLLPTLCDAAGVPLPADRTIDGVSWLPLLRASPRPRGVTASSLAATYAAPADASSTTAANAAAAAAAIAAAISQPSNECGATGRTLRFDLGEVVHAPQEKLQALPPPQEQPLPRPLFGAATCRQALPRRTPLFWAMHRGRGGMQYAMRMGTWKLLAGYGSHADRSHGPKGGTDVVPWIREAQLGRVELYLISHDPSERVDLSRVRPDIVALMLPRLQRLVHEVAKEGPDTPGWVQRSAPCPRHIRSLNITEECCQHHEPIPATRPTSPKADADVPTTGNDESFTNAPQISATATDQSDSVPGAQIYL